MSIEVHIDLCLGDMDLNEDPLEKVTLKNQRTKSQQKNVKAIMSKDY